MTTKPLPAAVTNGEYYDTERKTWVVQCGSTAVAIRKVDKHGQPLPPPAKVSNSEQ